MYRKLQKVPTRTGNLETMKETEPIPSWKRFAASCEGYYIEIYIHICGTVGTTSGLFEAPYTDT